MLNWILNKTFPDDTIRAPFKIISDIDYYDSLCDKYKAFYHDIKAAGADQESLEIVDRYTKKIKEAIRRYYDGRISTSHTIIKNLLRELLDSPLAVSDINHSKVFPGMSEEIQLYRARINEKVVTYAPKEMLHIPFAQRGKTGNYRFSIPGIPSLYLGNSTYACWIELGCPAEYKFNVSPVLSDGTQKILNLAVMTRRQWDFNERESDYVHDWLKLIVLMIATSYVIEERNRIFKSEYIVSQSIMLGCKELGLDGVAYFSKRVDDEVFAASAINAALFTTYKKGHDYSKICEHIKVGESYNYSLYKQLGHTDRNPAYDAYRLHQTGVVANIGNYNRQFSYEFTDFCAFDKFLFATWKNKDKIKYGNAVK